MGNEHRARLGRSLALPWAPAARLGGSLALPWAPAARFGRSLALPWVLVALVLAGPAAAQITSLRFDVVDKAGWQGAQAGKVPATVAESYAYDAGTDTVTVTEKFDRRGFAPLPPMLALARKYGFPVEVTPQPTDTGHDNVLGPLVGVEGDGFTWRVKGLGKYVLQRPASGAGKAPVDLTDELQRQVEKIIAAGHLAPWLVLVNVPGSGANDRGDIYWQSASDTLYLLAEAAPYLPAPTLAKLRAYLKAERDAYPPEVVLSAPLNVGARREVTPPDAALLKRWEDVNLAYRCHGLPRVWALYGLSRYYELMGETPDPDVMAICREVVARTLENRDWATLYWLRGHTPEFNAVHAVNQLFAGFAGTIRLSRLAGDKETEALAWGMLARMAALRFAMGKYTQYLYNSRQFNPEYGALAGGGERKPEQYEIKVQDDPARAAIPDDPAWWAKKHAGSWIGELVTWHWTKPIDDVRQVHRLDETGVDVWEWGAVDCYGTGQKRDLDPKNYWYGRLAPHLLPFRDLTPELGRFLRDTLQPECDAYCRRVAENEPGWYAAYSEAILGAEIGFSLPTDSHGQLLARAWVLGEKPEVLEHFVDVPWLPVGDLFYVHKLAVAVGAYRG